MPRPGKKPPRNDDSAGPIVSEILDVLTRMAGMLVSLLERTSACDDGAIESLVHGIIAGEKRVDRLREKHVQELFTKKRFLPSFQKADSMKIVSLLDDVTDRIELVARHVDIFAPARAKIPDALQEGVKTCAKLTTDVVVALAEAVRLVHVDFTRAMGACDAVQDKRRIARDTQWTLLKNLVASGIDVRLTFWLHNLVRLVVDIADKAEELSDEIHGLAIKYLVLD